MFHEMEHDKRVPAYPIFSTFFDIRIIVRYSRSVNSFRAVSADFAGYSKPILFLLPYAGKIHWKLWKPIDIFAENVI